MELMATCSTSSSSSSSLLSPKHTFPTTQELDRRRYNLQSCGNRATAAVKSSSSSAVWNGYAGTSGDISRANYNDNNTTNKTSKNSSRFYTRMDSCLIIPSPIGTKPRAIVKFLGGAFLGAARELTYSYVIEMLAKEGFLVISVPYNVTFDHADAAKQVYERFNAWLDSVLESGLPHANLAPAQISELLAIVLQILTGSYFCERIPKANAIISYNNRPATEAVPYFEQLGPLVREVMPVVEASPVYSMARSASGDAWKALIDAAGAIIPNNYQETLLSVTKFVGQLPSVFNEVTQGISEFKPTPSENRDRCKNSYNIKHTLLDKFRLDTIDETDLLEETLKPRVELIGGTLEKVQLRGNHITPCIQEPKWQVGDVYTPADAIAQGLKTLSLNDSRVLLRTISNWFRRFDD